MLRLRNIIIVLGLFITAWIGWHINGYFFDTDLPSIKLTGIEENGYYAGDVQCLVSGNHHYKIADISIFLDSKLIVNKFRINKRNFTYQFPLSTKSLSDGHHILEVTVTDGTRQRHTKSEIINFETDNTALQARFISPEQNFKISQGHTFHVQFQTNKEIKNAKISIFAQQFTCNPETQHSLIYECFIPIACEETPNEYPFSIEIEDHVGNRQRLDGKLQIIPFPFKTRIINVKSEKMVQEKEIGKPQDIFEEELKKAVNASPKTKLWTGLFIIPAQYSHFSCPFGEVRTTQEKGRYIHNGLDVIALPKSVAWAPQEGKVVLKDRFAFTGNTVIIDHGLGVFSLLFHLDNFADIKVGDIVKKGNPVGTVGKTGYATGYHLHWEMRIHNIPVDPLQWTRTDF